MEDLATLERSAWAKETRRLLEAEWAAENELAVEELDTAPRSRLERLGRSIGNLRASEWRTGLYGRTVVGFTSCRGARALDAALQTGDVVRVVPNNGPDASTGTPPSGIVSKVTPVLAEVAFDAEDLQLLREVEPLRIDKLPNDAAHRRQLSALDEVEHMNPSAPCSHAAQVLFGESQPLQHATPQTEDLALLNAGLNEPQRAAVALALRSRDVALIHGPPGTGKTTAVVELVRQATQVQGLRVLVCAPSNVAVDNIVLRLSAYTGRTSLPYSLRPVRVGHPARLLPEVLEHSLDAVVRRAEGAEIVRDVRDELAKAVQEMTGKPRSKSKSKGKRVDYRALRAQVKELRGELRTREKKLVGQVLSGSNVVLATNTGAAGVAKLLRRQPQTQQRPFDLVIIDEAAQAIEASCWIPIMLGCRVVLAGDHKQLPPTIKSQEAMAGILGKTLFDRVVEMHGERVVRLLSIQYRMHQRINDWASAEMYDGLLVADASVAGRMLVDLPHVKAPSDPDALQEAAMATLVMVDTAFCGMEEAVEGEGEEEGEGGGSSGASGFVGSRFNEGEAAVVRRHLKALFELGLAQKEVAVITPYNAQVQLLRSMLLDEYPQLEIRSVDGFQGREKEAVVLSLVRSNASGEVGFLSDDRRLNVAITRAKRHVCVVCDSETLSSRPDSFLSRMVDYFHEHATILSAELFAPGAGVVAHAPPASQKAKAKAKAAPKAAPKPRVSLPDARRNELRELLQAFVRDSAKRPVAARWAVALDLPATLSPAERHAVHELATEMGLDHESFGEGERRFVRVARPVVASDKQQDPVKAPAMQQEQTAPVKAPVVDDEVEDEDEDEDEEGDDEHEHEQGEEEQQEQQEGEEDEEDEEEESVDEAAERGSGQVLAQNDAAKAFAAKFLPRKYEELVAQGIPPNEACVQAVQATQAAFIASQQQTCAATDAAPAASGQAPPPAPAPTPAPAPSKPKTELEKIREMQAARYAVKKQQEAAKKEQEAAEWAKSGGGGGGKGKRGKGKSKKKKKTPQQKSKPEGRKLVSGALPEVTAVAGSDPELAFLDAMLAANKRCAADGCSQSVQTTGSTCSSCKLRFCFEHCQAEVHGCATAARQAARKAFRAQAATRPDERKPLKAHQKAHLKRELSAKLAEEAAQRQRKQPPRK